MTKRSKRYATAPAVPFLAHRVLLSWYLAYQHTGGSAMEAAFPVIRTNEREGKPRSRCITEIRGPYYTRVGKRYLQDLLETMGAYVASLKFAGGAFVLMPRDALAELIDLAHRYDVLGSTGGFIERVLTQGADAVDAYISACRELSAYGIREFVNIKTVCVQEAAGRGRSATE
jgi:phosphosulfolactate synthase (CoM biosynthesis protein A)